MIDDASEPGEMKQPSEASPGVALPQQRIDRSSPSEVGDAVNSGNDRVKNEEEDENDAHDVDHHDRGGQQGPCCWKKKKKV